MKVVAPIFMVALGVVVFLRFTNNKLTASKPMKEKSWDEWFDRLNPPPDFMTNRDQWRRT